MAIEEGQQPVSVLDPERCAHSKIVYVVPAPQDGSDSSLYPGACRLRKEVGASSSFAIEALFT